VASLPGEDHSKVFNVVRHLFLAEASIDQNEVLDDLPQSVRRAAAVDNTGMCDTGVGQRKEIRIISNNDSSFAQRKLNVAAIGCTKEVGVRGSRHINPATTKPVCDGVGDVFIQVKPHLSPDVRGVFRKV